MMLYWALLLHPTLPVHGWGFGIQAIQRIHCIVDIPHTYRRLNIANGIFPF